jgi:hypothetical protein
VTSPPQPAPGASAPVGQHLRPLRDLAAYALVGATAIWLLVAVIDLIPGGPNEFAGRSEASFDHFVNLPNIAFPLLAVLLALMVEPRHPKAQLIVLAAVVEYAVIAFFGVLFGLLIGLINTAADVGVRATFEGLLARIGWLAVLAVAGYAVFVIWQRMFTAPRPPKPAQGVYGQPPQFSPGAYPGQPGYGPQFPPGPPPGQGPGQHPGPPPPPPPGGYGPTTYGQPPQNPNWNQAPTAMQQHPAPPYPVSGQPAPGWPAPGAPASAPPFSEPTQVVPQQHSSVPEPDAPVDDRTQKLDDNRPGFGPADPDQPRN